MENFETADPTLVDFLVEYSPGMFRNWSVFHRYQLVKSVANKEVFKTRRCLKVANRIVFNESVFLGDDEEPRDNGVYEAKFSFYSVDGGW